MIDFPRKDDAEFFGEAFVLKYAETVEHPKLTLNIRFHFDREYIRVHGLRFKFAIILINLANFCKP